MDAAPPGPAARLAVSLLAASVIALGVAVMLGWVLRLPTLVQLLPGYSAMAFVTALDFVALGLALLMRSVYPAGRRAIPILLAIAALGIGAATLAAYAIDAPLYIDFPALHAWLDNHPGRMAPNTALAFVFGAVATLLLLSGDRVLVGTLTLILSFIVGLMGLVGIAGYELRPELLYGWNINVRMALHTATGFILLGSGIGVEAYRRGLLPEYFGHRPDIKIGLIGGALLAGATVIAGLSAFVALQRQTEDTLARGMDLALDNRIALIEAEVERGITGAVLITTHPIVRESLARLRTAPNHAEALRLLRETAFSFLPYGLSAVRLDDHRGREIANRGAWSNPTLTVRLTTAAEADLVWHDRELRLRVRVPVADAGVRLGTLLIERPLFAITAMLNDVIDLGATAEMVLCAERRGRIRCFPSKLQPEVFEVPYAIGGQRLPVSYALAGERGSIITGDYRQQNVLAIYAPVAALGLATVLKVDTVELYRPVRAQLERAIIMLIVLTIAGIVLLRIALLPLVRRMVESESRVRGAFEALNERETRLRAVMDATPDAMVISSTDGRITLVNAQAEQLFGYDRTEMIGQPVELLQPERYRNTHVTHRQRYTDGPRTRPMGDRLELFGRRKDGTEFPIEIGLSPVKTPDGLMIISAVRDITARKQAQEALRASEERFRALARNAPVGIFVTDRDGHCTYVNEHWTRITGQSHDDAVGFGWTRVVHPGDRERLLMEWRSTSQRGDKFTSEYRVVTSDGHNVWVLVGAVPVHDAAGVGSGYIGTVMDISGRKRAEETIRELSLIDELTGLRNRRGFQTLADVELNLARRQGRGLWLFYADLDGMKIINDTFGHTVGDQALKDTAGVLRKTFRDTDVLARLGGDEFAVLSLETKLMAPDAVLARLRANIDAYNRSAARPYQLSISIGAVRFDPEKHAGLDQLLADGDAKMYGVKRGAGIAR